MKARKVIEELAPHPRLRERSHPGNERRVGARRPRREGALAPTAGTLLATPVLADALAAVVSSIDSLDPYNAAHSRRVTRLCVRFGEELGISPTDLELLQVAALLHDVGKIGVAHAILRKPASLDPDEWVAMQQHPNLGENILRQVGALSEVATIVRHHHERFDGGGYPDGLAAAAIPLLSRVIHIVDAFEAMTSDRAYRPALPAKRARRILEEGLGAQFDPDLGREFLRFAARV